MMSNTYNLFCPAACVSHYLNRRLFISPSLPTPPLSFRKSIYDPSSPPTSKAPPNRRRSMPACDHGLSRRRRPAPPTRSLGLHPPRPPLSRTPSPPLSTCPPPHPIRPS